MKKPVVLESPVQRAIIELCGHMRLEAVAIPNGAHLSGDRLARIKQMARLKADGLRPGFPDLHIIGQAPRSGYIETKRSDGGKGLSVDQEWWRDRLIALGHHWACCTSVSEAADAFRAWGWTR